MRKNEELEASYFYYTVLSEWFIKVVDSSTYGSKMPRANWEFIGSLQILLPSISEQIAIADYLDAETARISRIIALKNNLIERLHEKRIAIISHAVTKGLDSNAKMKPSGIEWIGDVPERWEIKKIKYVGIVKGRIGFKGYSVSDLVDEFEDGAAIVLGGTNIMFAGKISYEKLTYISEYKYFESPEIMLSGGEILITKVGAGTGENALYSHYREMLSPFRPKSNQTFFNRTIISLCKASPESSDT